MRAVWKVRGLTLLPRVGTLWRGGDGLFFEVRPLANDALLTTLRPLSENGVTAVLKEPGGASLVERQRCATESGKECAHRTFAIQFRSRPHAISGLFQPWKRSSEAKNFEVIKGLQNVFENWEERCKKCIDCQGRYFEKETVTTPSQRSDTT
jgi:hypothetical protein